MNVSDMLIRLKMLDCGFLLPIHDYYGRSKLNIPVSMLTCRLLPEECRIVLPTMTVWKPMVKHIQNVDLQKGECQGVPTIP